MKERIVQLSVPNDRGVYREGEIRRQKRTEVVAEALRMVWNRSVSAALNPQAAAASAVPVVPVAPVAPVAPADSAPYLEGIALVAVGSVARGELGPHSDLDLSLIYDDSRVKSDRVKAIADGLWYPLWDAGISLDYSVRTVRECTAVTDSDLPAAIGWLTVLPLAGDTALVTQVSQRILTRWRGAASKRIGDIETSVSVRGEEFGSLATMSQPNVKEARGGLRDGVLVSALADSWLADRPHGAFDDARRQLLDLRDCLHLAAGKETNVLLPEYQAKIAALMGLVDPTLPAEQRESESAADVQALIARLGRRISYSLDATLNRARHSLIHERPRFGWWPRRPSGRRAAPRLESVAAGVSLHEGQIVLDTRADVIHDRSLPLRVGVAAAQRGIGIAPVTVNSLAELPVDDSSWTPESRGLFVDLLATGPALVPTWESLDMARVPSRLIPEWDAIRNRPSASTVHRFTIDRHSIEVVSRLGELSPMGEPYTKRQHEELLLAAIFHDIGKRRGIADHSAEGARQATTILYRMGYSPDTIAHAVLLIREHLSLSDFALNRDPSDKGVLEELSQRLAGNPFLLDMLYDLTRADASSLGATPGELLTKRIGWSEWRERLVTQMYRAARAWMVR